MIVHGSPGRSDGSGVKHEVVLTQREKILITGVLNVESFDDKEVVLHTDYGLLSLKGENMHIRQLDIDAGNFAIEGLVTSLQYSAGGRDVRDRGKGFLDRLLR